MKHPLRLHKSAMMLVVLGSISAAIFIYSINIRFHNNNICRPLSSSILSEKTEQEPLVAGFQFTEYNEGKKVFNVKAQKMYLCNKLVKPFNFRIAFGKVIELEGVDVLFYKGDKPISGISSKTASMNPRDKAITFSGRPVLSVEDKRILMADEIRWDNAARRIYAQGSCFLSADGKKYRADKVDTDIELSNFTLSNEKGYKNILGKITK